MLEQAGLDHQWSGQKSGGDSAVRSEFFIAGMIFHPSRGKREVLHKEIAQAFVAWARLPACHREDVWLLALLHAPGRRAHAMARRERGGAMQIAGGSGTCLRVQQPGARLAVAEETRNLETRGVAVEPF